jgi:hypothetical protein
MRKLKRIDLLAICLLLLAVTAPIQNQVSGAEPTLGAAISPSASVGRIKNNENEIVGQPQYVGIPRNEFEFYAAAQQNSQWCWAASIQMVLNYYGVSIGQQQIVGRTYGTDPYGRLPNWSGSFQAITANLNNWSIDNNGAPYVVQASVYPGAPTPAYLLRELQDKHPVMIGYASGPQSGHAVVITAASYIPSPQGPMIQSLIVRDPWPSPANVQNRGRVEYPGAALAQYIQAHWYVRVQKG